MGTLDTSYEVPYEIYWAQTSITTSSAVTSSTAQVPYGGTAARYICWKSPYRTFQVQYRYRRRLAPTNSSYKSNTNDLEQWTDYTSWAGMTEDVATVDMGALNNRFCWWPSEFSWSYDISDYDTWEYEVRVRPFDTSSLTYGNWAEKTLEVHFCPSVTLAGGYMDDEGGLAVNYTTNWPLDGNYVYSSGGVNYGITNSSGTQISKTAFRVTDLPGTMGTFTVDKSIIGGLDLTGQTITFKRFTFGNSDNMSTAYTDLSISVTEQVSVELSDPVVVATVTDNNTIAVTVTPPSGVTTISSWSLWGSYAGEDGIAQSLDGEVLSTGTSSCEGVLYIPPFDVPITITVSMAIYANFQSYTLYGSTTVTIPSSASIYLTNADDNSQIEIPYSPEWSDSYTPNVEVGDAIAGRSLPPVYVGEGGTCTIKISGYIRAEDLAEAEQALNMPARWIMRSSNGVRREGTITKASFDRVYDSRMVSLSITMSEGS